jgi:HlyD family secretion protein
MIAARPPLLARGLAWIIAGLVAGSVAVAGVLPVDRVVVARGRVVSSSPTVRVQPLDVSIVRSIDVRVGQVVRPGDLLARLDPTFASADFDALQRQAASLEVEVARLRAEAGGIPFTPADDGPAAAMQASIHAQRRAEFDFRLQNYQQRLSSLEATIARANGERRYLSERLTLASQIEDMRRELQRQQVGSRLNALVATDNRVELSRGLAAAEATLSGSQKDLQALQAERDAFTRKWRGDTAQMLVEQERKLSDAREQLSKARLRHQLVELRAKQDAVVLSVEPVSVGSVMASGAELISLVPLDSQFEVEADVDGRDSGFVQVGQTVDIKFDAFPFMRHGKATGSVRVLSADAFRVDDNNRPAGPYYKTRVSLDAAGLYNIPSEFRLMPGMPVTVDVRVGERNMLAYFYEHFARPAQEAFREP